MTALARPPWLIFSLAWVCFGLLVGRSDNSFALRFFSLPSFSPSPEANDSEWARKQLAVLKEVSPISLHITFEQLKRGAKLDLADCLKMEYTIVQHLMVRAKSLKSWRWILMSAFPHNRRATTFTRVCEQVRQDF